MDIEFLQRLMDPSKRKEIYKEIINFFQSLDKFDDIHYKGFQISEGTLPMVEISKVQEIDQINSVKIFMGAQHNEYNGLFGIMEFLENHTKNKDSLDTIIKKGQVLIFFPLMNLYGFLNPSLDNKSGYYLRTGANLNRFWRHAFAPEYPVIIEEVKKFPEPEQVKIVKSVLETYWSHENITITLMDFHETSLLERFPRELSVDLTSYYKFDHWLKEAIVENILDLYEIPHYRKPLFFKCGPNADHEHINLSYKQIDRVLEKLREYMVENYEKLAFYYCFSHKSEDFCKKLSKRVYNSLKEDLWRTEYPAYPHDFHDHGCFVKMSDATERERVFTMELENQKQFFNLFEEIEKSNRDPEYFIKKIDIINKSMELVKKTIAVMIELSDHD